MAPTSGAGFQADRHDADTDLPASIGLRWAVWLCPPAAGAGASSTAAPTGGGDLVICRLDGRCPGADAATTAALLSRDPVDVAGITELGVGPDEFWVDLAGQEYARLVPSHAGECSYAAPLPVVAVPGNYSLRVLHTYGGYTAAADVDASAWPALHLDNVLGNSTVVALPLGAAAPAANASAAAVVIAAALAGAGLPPCTTADQLAHGRWVVNTPVSAKLAEQAHWSWRWLPWAYPFHPEQLAWVPYGCAWTPLPVAPAAHDCLAGAHVSMQGDSQTRTFFNGAMGAVGGVPHAAQKGFLDSQCWRFNASHPLLPRGLWCFTFQPYPAPSVAWEPPPPSVANASSDPDRFPDGTAASSPSYRWDVLLLNFGQWTHPWNYSRYRDEERGYFDAVAAGTPPTGGGHPPPTLVWATTQDAAPPHFAWDVGQRRQRGDRRTRPRLRYISQLGLAAARAHNDRVAAAGAGGGRGHFQLLPSYAPSLQSAFLSPDYSHVHFPPYQRLLVDMLLRLLPGCGRIR